MGAVQLQILQLIEGRVRREVTAQDHSAADRGQAKGSDMYVVTIHSVSDPKAFWGGQLDLPKGTELPIVVPGADGSRGVCVFKSDSVDTVKALVDGATSAISSNEFYAINEANALGLPG
jgi:hypothetical protein